MNSDLIKRLRAKETAHLPGGYKLCAEAADAITELLRAASAMHTWIFLNTEDEQAAYDECGLSLEMNAALGGMGRFEMEVEDD